MSDDDYDFDDDRSLDERPQIISLLDFVQNASAVSEKSEKVVTEIIPIPEEEVIEKPIEEMDEDELMNEFTVRRLKFGTDHESTAEVRTYYPRNITHLSIVIGLHSSAHSSTEFDWVVLNPVCDV